jgi:hypothetical protein
MFDSVGDVNFAPFDTCLFECSVEYFAGRTDELMAFDILSITGLLTYQHHLGSGPTFAENGLLGTFPYVATATLLGSVTKIAQRCSRRYEVSGRVVVLIGGHD